jgi:methylphosphotriester-DNA--protein-cysteine methyltransferase
MPIGHGNGADMDLTHRYDAGAAWLCAIEALAMRDQSVTAIAMDVGYGSLSAFNAAFRDLIGKAPGVSCVFSWLTTWLSVAP